MPVAVVFFVAAAIVFAVKTFGGHIGTLDLISLGLTLLSLGLVLAGDVVGWVRRQAT